MSAAEHQSSKSSYPTQSAGKSLKRPPQRPSLRQPPSRSQETSSEAAAPAPVKPSRPAVKPSVIEVRKSSVDQSAEISNSAAEATVKAETAVETASKPKHALHPISPPSERMQYRAIGLVRGTYTPSEEQLNRGCLVTEEGTLVDSVLLGRITSLVKKYIDLHTSHLWVVYPRTRQVDEDADEQTEREADTPEESGKKETDLHLQIVGVWEPETLGMPGENPDHEINSQSELKEEEVETSIPQVDGESQITIEQQPVPVVASASETSEAEATPVVSKTEALETPPVDKEAGVQSKTATSEAATAHIRAEDIEQPSDNYFSIRGEILDFNEESNQILVKILQAAKRSERGQKAFRLHVSGHISGRTVGYFWELDVERQGKELVLVDGRPIGIVPPKKRKKKKHAPSGRGKRPHQRPRPHQSAPHPKSKPRIRPSAPVKSNPL